MNIWLKEISIDDDKTYCDLLIELANYPDVYARPVPIDFTYDDYEYFKKTRVRMANNDNLPSNVVQTNTYWVMSDEEPIGYATLKHKIDETVPGGYFGLWLKKTYQNKGIGTIVSNELSKIAYYELGLEEVIYTSKNENIQSQKSLEKIGAELYSIHDGYHFYRVNLKEKLENTERRMK